MHYETLTFAAADGIARMTLNRPDRLNAMSPRMIEEINLVLDRCDKDDAIRVLVMTGNGRGFCARCGSRLLDPPEPGDTLVEIRLGSLDEAPFDLKPETEVWVKRRESWLPPVDGAAQHDESRH